MTVPILHRYRLLSITLLACLCMTVPATAQEEENHLPKIALAAPLAAVPGTTTQLTLRGWKFEKVSAVRPSDERATVKFGEQGEAPVPGGQNAERIGDRQVVIDLELPAGFDADVLSLVVVTEAGESEPYELLVGGKHPVQSEQEPNNGFAAAQALDGPTMMDGSIHSDRDVDVVQFQGQAGQPLVCELVARRRGSGCDGTLTLYNAQRSPIAYSDDADGSRDPRLEVTLPSSGRYYLAIADANDQGGPAHPYRFILH